MILSGFGLNLSESELRKLCDCSFEGTEALKAVDAARLLGFSKTAKHTLSIGELETLVAAGKYPIIYIDLLPIEGKRITHALLVTDVAADFITVYDPERGERAFARDLLIEAWKRQHYLTIIVEQ